MKAQVPVGPGQPGRVRALTESVGKTVPLKLGDVVVGSATVLKVECPGGDLEGVWYTTFELEVDP